MKSKKNIKKLRNNKSKINKKNKRKLKSNRKTNKKITGGANKPFTVTVTSDAHGEQEVHVIYTDKIHNAITRAFGFRENEKVLEVSYGDEPVDSHESFKDIGIEDGGRLSVAIYDSPKFNNQNCISRIGFENLKKDKQILRSNGRGGESWEFDEQVHGGKGYMGRTLTTDQLIASECDMEKYLSDNNYKMENSFVDHGDSRGSGSHFELYRSQRNPLPLFTPAANGDNLVRDLEAAILVEHAAEHYETEERLRRWHKTMTTHNDEDYKKYARERARDFLAKHK